MVEYSGKTIQSTSEAVTGKLCRVDSAASDHGNCAKIILWDGKSALGDALLYAAVGVVVASEANASTQRYVKKIAEFYRIPAIKINRDMQELEARGNNRIVILDPQSQKLFIEPDLETINNYFGARPRKAPCSPTLLLRCHARLPDASGEFGGIVVSAARGGRYDEENIYEHLCDIADRNTGTKIIATLSLGSNDSEFISAVRAVYRASVWGRFPLLCSGVGSPDEARRCVSLIHTAFRELDAEEREFNGFIPKGLVIETPLMLLSKPCHRIIDFFCFDYPKLTYRFTGSKGDGACEEIAKYMSVFAKNAGITKIALSTDRELPEKFTAYLHKENVLSEMYVPKALVSLYN
ncbi:MAG: hypothetical protein IKJ00_09210 [Clostridia bacterium]|nr:hypothetical protein [Clostridia bacterium]